MSSIVLTPGAVLVRAAATNVPLAVAAIAVLAFVAWLVQRGSAAQEHDSRRASFLRALANSPPESIPGEVYVAYAEDPDWRGTALRWLTDPDLPEGRRQALRHALAAA